MANVPVLTSTAFFWPGVACALLLLYVVYDVFYNLFISPLSRIPGPKLWAISRIPSHISLLRGHCHLDAAALHDHYGPVIRIGPNELSFITAQAFRDIYALGSRFTKYKPRYVTPVNGVDHLVNVVDDADHARHRRLLSHAFSERALRDQEPLIRGYVDTLMSKLREMTIESTDGDDGSITKVDIKGWINFTTFDTIGDLVSGESFNCLQDSQLHPWVSLNFDSIKATTMMAVVNEYPLLNTVLRKMIPRHLKQAALDHFNMSAEKVDRRLERGSDRPDFMSAFLKNGLSEKNGQYDEDQRVMTRAELHSNGFALILAGSETTGSLLSGCVYHLCKSAHVTQRLVSEIRTAFTADEEIIFSKTIKLPYLAAVVEETFRSYPPFVTSLGRVTPAGGRVVDGHYVPENTIVSCHHYAAYHSSTNFALPYEFVPERWLGTGGQFASDKRDALQPFSLGPRHCIGKNLAYAQIRLILCKLLFNFDIVGLCPESQNWLDGQEVYLVWDKPPLMVILRDRFQATV